jgi:chlorophyllide a reductase subunit Y
MAVTLDIAALRARKERPASTLGAVPASAEVVNLAAAREDGHGCHAGKDATRSARRD